MLRWISVVGRRRGLKTAPALSLSLSFAGSAGFKSLFQDDLAVPAERNPTFLLKVDRRVVI